MNESDKKLLELAAKAAGELHLIPYKEEWLESDEAWNPLTDDGDAFCLAAAVGIDIFFMGSFARVMKRINDVLNWTDVRDPYSNMGKVRRAVVITAAEVGKTMP